MKGFLSKIWREKTHEDALDRAVRKGQVDVIDRFLMQGTDPVEVYEKIRKTGKGHKRAIDFLEKYIEDIALHPGTHVPRPANWKIKR